MTNSNHTNLIIEKLLKSVSRRKQGLSINPNDGPQIFSPGVSSLKGGGIRTEDNLRSFGWPLFGPL